MSRRYTSYERDSNGGDEAQARRYQSKWTRFSQPDPFDGSYDITDPQSFNRYSYVGNDPVNKVDPNGLDDLDNWIPGPGDTIDGGTARARLQRWGPFDAAHGGFSGIMRHYSEYETRFVSPFWLNRERTKPEPQKPSCPPVPEAPPGANLDGNIRSMQDSARHANEISPYPDAGDDPAARTLGHISGFAARVAPGGPWDYKSQNTREDQYTPFGNFNFGATGAAAGFSEGQLLRAAGWVQYWSYKLGITSHPGDGGRVSIIAALTGEGGQAPFSDQEVDQANIRAGINYYNRKFVKGDCQ